MITIEVTETRLRFGRLRKRTQWRFSVIAGNGRRIDPRDTYANPDDIEAIWRKILAPNEPVEIVYRWLDGHTLTERLR